MKCKNLNKKIINKYICEIKEHNYVWVYNTSINKSQTGVFLIDSECMDIEDRIERMNENLNYLEMELLKSEGIKYLNENFEVYIWKDEEYGYWSPIYFWYNPNWFNSEFQKIEDWLWGGETEEEIKSLSCFDPVVKNLFSKKYTTEEMFVQFAKLYKWVPRRKVPPIKD